MTLVAFILFLTCAIIVASMFRHGADVLSPGRVFVFIWAWTIGLAELKLSNLQHEWSAQSWLLLLLGPAAFLAGLFAANMINIRQPLVPIEEIRTTWRGEPTRRGRLFAIIVVLFILLIIGYLVLVFTGHEIPIFSSNPGRARLQFQMFGFGLFLHNVVLIVFLTAIYYLRVPGDRWRKRTLLVFSLIGLLIYGLTLQRFQILMSVILCLIVIYYTTHSLRFSRVLMAFGLAAVYFIVTSSLRGGQLYMYYLYKTSQMNFPVKYAVFTEPYMYFAMNLENFVRAIDHLQNFTFGAYTFDFVAALSGLKHWMKEYFALDDTPFLTSGYNTYSYFFTYYRDFGAAGLAILPFGLGVLTGSIYYAMRRRPTLTTVCGYAVCVFTMMFSFYLNSLSLLWYVYNVVVLYVVLRFIRLPESGEGGLRGVGAS